MSEQQKLGILVKADIRKKEFSISGSLINKLPKGIMDLSD